MPPALSVARLPPTHHQLCPFDASLGFPGEGPDDAEPAAEHVPLCDLRRRTWRAESRECRVCAAQLARGATVHFCTVCGRLCCGPCRTRLSREEGGCRCEPPAPLAALPAGALACPAEDQAAEGHPLAVPIDERGPACGPAVDELLRRATSRPALPTLVAAPPAAEKRALEQCLAALAALGAVYSARVVSEVDAERASMWAWLMPTLLLRRPRGPGTTALPGEHGCEGPNAAPARRQVKATDASDLSLTRLLRARVQQAELGRWHALLVEYCAELDEEEASVAPLRARPDADSDDQARSDARVVQLVQGDAVARSKHELMQAPRPPRNAATADAVSALACVPIDASEEQRIREELAKAFSVRDAARRPKRRTLRRRLATLRSAAAPGPSGWRNSHILRLFDLPGGPEALVAFAAVVAAGRFTAADAMLWCGAVLEPVDCGPKPEPEPDAAAGQDPGDLPRKLRPIALTEALVKLSESMTIDECIDDIRRALEPSQLGAATPDGAVLAVRILRGWARDIEEGGDTALNDVIAGTDLENAFGRLFRSSGLAATRALVPRLAPMLAGQWRNGCSVAWQRVAEAPGAWRRDLAWRGGWQGSRLTQIAFCLDLRQAIADSGVAAAAAVQHVGVADDLYLVGNASTLASGWPALEQALAAHGHRLRRSKCKFWAPARDGPGEAAEGAPAAGDAAAGVHLLAEIIPRVRGGMMILGSAAQGEWEALLGPYSEIAAPAVARASSAAAVAERLAAFAKRRLDPNSLQVAWTILQKSVARALDFDTRLCPSWALHEARSILSNAVCRVTDALAGPGLDADAREQLALPGCLGGCALRGCSESACDAAFWATYAAHTADVCLAAERLGRPLRGPVDEASAQSAAGSLLEEGVSIADGFLKLTDRAAAEYGAGPWVADTPVESLFCFAGEHVRDEGPAANPPSVLLGDAPAPAEGSAAWSGTSASAVERGARRRILGRLLRGLDSLRATRLWQRMGAHRREALLSGGGSGAGSLWAAVPSRPHLRLTSAQWQVAVRGRLGLMRAPAGATCRLPRADAGEVCGAPLDECLRHASLCAAGPIRMRTHRALVMALRLAAEREGAYVDVERAIPEYYMVSGTGAVVEAILDAVIRWPGAGSEHRIDVSVRCPFAARYPRTDSVPGVAAAAGGKEKRDRYGTSVSPLIFETGGRIGHDGLETLAALQRDARMYGRRRLGRPPGFDMRVLRLSLEVALAREVADATLLSLGCRSAAALGWTLPATV